MLGFAVKAVHQPSAETILVVDGTRRTMMKVPEDPIGLVSGFFR